MPFLLRKDGPVNDAARATFPAVSFTNSSELDFSTDWEIEIDIAVTGSDLPFLSDDFDSSKLLFFRAGNRLEFRSSKLSTLQITFAQSYAERHTYRIVSNPSLSRIEVYQDGVLGGTISGNSLDSYDTIFNFGNSSRLGDLYSLKFYKDGVLERDYTKQAVVGGNDTEFTDQENAQNGTLVDFPTDNSQWVFFDDGGGAVTPEPELHEFSGNAIVNALSFAQISKTAQHNGLALVNVSTSGQSAKLVTLSSDSLVTASAAASSTKVVNTSGAASIKAQSVSLFEKLNTFNGNARVDATSQSSASKRVAFSGQATVSITASASIIDGNFEIHSFSGGALITASASGQTVKVGLVSGNANVTTSVSAQASKTAQLSGNATVSTSTQSLFSKIASVTGNALTRVTTLTTAVKRVTLSGVSRVFATAYGTFFNTESNVETYELTVQGRVKAPIVVQGTIKSLTIQGRVK